MAKAIFSNIQAQICSKISASANSIRVAVAWFTNEDLLGHLIKKAECGCKVEIIISDHQENKRLDFKKLISKGGQVFVITTVYSKFLHDKYSIFDSSKVVAGSYNWTYSAEYYNHEFVIESGEEMLVSQFSIRFEKLKNVAISYADWKMPMLRLVLENSSEEEFFKLEQELKSEMLNSISTARKLKIDIKDSIIHQINSYGAIGAAKRLISHGDSKLHSGFIKLFIAEQLDLSLEHIVLKERYSILFSEELKAKAKDRLGAFKKG